MIDQNEKLLFDPQKNHLMVTGWEKENYGEVLENINNALATSLSTKYSDSQMPIASIRANASTEQMMLFISYPRYKSVRKAMQMRSDIISALDSYQPTQQLVIAGYGTRRML